MNLNLNRRVVDLQSWWVGSELTRRHAELGLIETHPLDGFYDCLSIIRWREQEHRFIDLNREGRLHVHPHNIGAITWQEEREAEDRRWAVRRLEELADLPAPAKTPSTNPQTMTHRLSYYLLLLGLNDRDPWDVRSARKDPIVGYLDDTGDLDGFRSAQMAASKVRPDDHRGDPLYRFWKVSVGSDVVVTLDIDGQAHFPDGTSQDLCARFNEAGRSVEAVAVRLRRHILTT